MELFETDQANSSKPSLLSGQDKKTNSGASILSDLENDGARMGLRATRLAPRRLRIMLAFLAVGSTVVLLYQLTSRTDGYGNSGVLRADVVSTLEAKSAPADPAAQVVATAPSSVVSDVAETTQVVAENNEERLAANLPGLSALIVNEKIEVVDKKTAQPPANTVLNELVTMQPDQRRLTNAPNSAARNGNKTLHMRHVSNAQKKRTLTKAYVGSKKIAAVGKSPKNSAVPPKPRASEVDSDVTLIAAIVAHDNAAPVVVAEKPGKTTNAKKIENERNEKLIDAQ